MPTIHMDVEQVNAVLEQMANDEKEIREIMKNLTTAVTGIHATDWVGNAESEFYKEYDVLDTQLKNQIDFMEMLSDQLRQEIAEWEAMAARLA